MNCPQCDSPLKTIDACTCGWKAKPVKYSGNPFKYGLEVGGEWVDKQCAWNDHGNRCDRRGSMSQSTNGMGPWFCSDDYAKLMDWGPKAEVRSLKPENGFWGKPLYAWAKSNKIHSLHSETPMEFRDRIIASQLKAMVGK